MKISYLLSRYVSHLKAGTEYVRSLRSLGVEMVSDLEAADVVILHDEPPSYPLYFQQFPVLRKKYTIAYAVWEADILPDTYINGLRLVDEIWTCSKFTANILLKYFENVHKVPHVVPTYDVGQADLENLRKLIKYDPNGFYFYTITDTINPRKNLLATVDSFLKVLSASHRKVYLVIKQYRKALPYLSTLPNVISVDHDLEDSAIQALHAICDCYISSHCAEAWGLSISDAMSFGNLVVATGYSGNMEYMRDDNSYPVRYELRPIKEEDRRFQPTLLDPRMHWAYIDTRDLTRKMLYCLAANNHTELQQNAKRIAVEYSHANIAHTMMRRLTSISEALVPPKIHIRLSQ